MAATRRTSPLALVLALYGLWRRLPPKQRRQVLRWVTRRLRALVARRPR